MTTEAVLNAAMIRRKLDAADRQAIRGQLADGVPREKIATDLEVSLRRWMPSEHM